MHSIWTWKPFLTTWWHHQRRFWRFFSLKGRRISGCIATQWWEEVAQKLAALSGRFALILIFLCIGACRDMNLLLKWQYTFRTQNMPLPTAWWLAVFVNALIDRETDLRCLMFIFLGQLSVKDAMLSARNMGTFQVSFQVTLQKWKKKTFSPSQNRGRIENLYNIGNIEGSNVTEMMTIDWL